MEEQEDIMAMLRRRAKDDKVMVRKSSLQVIENIMRLNPGCVTPENLQVRDNTESSAYFLFCRILQLDVWCVASSHLPLIP